MRQVLRRDRLAAGDDPGVLHRVGQLADVARPVVLQQHLHRLGRQQVGDLLDRPLRGAGQQVPGQVRDVRPAVAQRRQVDLERVEPEEQVLAELCPRRSSPAGRGWWRRSRARPPDRLVLAEPLDLARFEEAEQLHLDVLVQLAELVEEQVPPLATSKRPLWSRSAPVNAPLRWPNSSLSTRFCVQGRRS